MHAHVKYIGVATVIFISACTQPGNYATMNLSGPNGEHYSVGLTQDQAKVCQQCTLGTDSKECILCEQYAGLPDTEPTCLTSQTGSCWAKLNRTYKKVPSSSPSVSPGDALVAGGIIAGLAKILGGAVKDMSSSSPPSPSPSRYDVERLHDQRCNQCYATLQSDKSRCRGYSDKGAIWGTWGAYSLSPQGKCMADAEKGYHSCKGGC